MNRFLFVDFLILLIIPILVISPGRGFLIVYCFLNFSAIKMRMQSNSKNKLKANVYDER